MWYNEEFLAPFFLNHYSYADQITIILDADTNDNSESIVKRYPNTKIVNFKFPDMMDDEIKSRIITEQYVKSKHNWVLAVDADEFVFYKKNSCFIYNLNRYLNQYSNYDLIKVAFYQIYKNIIDKKLDSTIDTVPQRRHGDPNIFSEHNKLYLKPILVKTGLQIKWDPGCHFLKNNNSKILVSDNILFGAHWAMADEEFVFSRRIKNRRERQSKNNIEKQMTVQHHNVTVKSIMEEFIMHYNDPQVF